MTTKGRLLDFAEGRGYVVAVVDLEELIKEAKEDFPTPCHDAQVDDWFWNWFGDDESAE